MVLGRGLIALAVVCGAVVAGAVTAFGVAQGIARYAPPPDSWIFRNEHTRKFALGYEEFFRDRPDSERMAILTGTSVGVHVIDLSYVAAEEFETMLHPPRLRRRLVTELGWPVAALKTEAPDVGRRFLPSYSQKQGPFVGEDGWQILPSGFAFNTMFFAAPWLVLLVWIGPIRRRSAAPAVLVCIAAGLWVAVAMAWAAYLFRDVSTLSYFARDDAEFAQRVGEIERPADEATWNAFEGSLATSFGSRIVRYHFGRTSVNDEGIPYYETVALRRFRHDIGWPLTAMTATSAEMPGPPAVSAAALFRFDVAWLGMLGNWSLCAALLLVLWHVPPRIRRHLRLRRNCCPACGYPIGRSHVCTECGGRLPAHAASSANDGTSRRLRTRPPP